MSEGRDELEQGVSANECIVTTASVTSLLDTLERRGLVERRPDPDDRRRLLVAITPPGQALARRFVPEVIALQTAVMNGISEEDRQHVIAVLTTDQGSNRGRQPVTARRRHVHRRRAQAPGRARGGGPGRVRGRRLLRETGTPLSVIHATAG